ncbi:MAG: hypothetical protein ABDH28_05595, partial [Brevinematia bacterium]
MFLEDTKKIHIKDLKIRGLTLDRKKILYRLKLYTVYDVLTYFPIRYEDRTELKSLSDIVKELSRSTTGKVRATTIVEVVKHDYIFVKQEKVLKVVVSDGELRGELVCYNRDFLASVFEVGKRFIVTGVWEYKYNSLQCATFDYADLEKDGYKKEEFGIVLPIYSAVEGVRQRTIRRAIHLVVDEFADSIEDEFPEYVMKTRNLLPLGRV